MLSFFNWLVIGVLVFIFLCWFWIALALCGSWFVCLKARRDIRKNIAQRHKQNRRVWSSEYGGGKNGEKFTQSKADVKKSGEIPDETKAEK